MSDPAKNPQSPPPARLLVIRFSSFGDIVQALGVPAAFRAAYPHAEVHWLVREDMAPLVKTHPEINHVWSFSRSAGFGGLFRLGFALWKSGFTHIYDAHNNLRSNVLCLLLLTLRAGEAVCSLGRSPRLFSFLQRPKSRLKRWMLFRLRWNLLPQPFRGADSFLDPLRKWQIQPTVPPAPQFFPSPASTVEMKARLASLQPFIVLVPSAAWEMKRWPLDSWKRLIELLPSQTFVVLGGPEDTFCEELHKVAPNRVHNLAGRLSLDASGAALDEAAAVVSGDTGLLHVADQLGRPTVALIGPTAFGYPYRPTSRVLELDLPCKPCSKDGRGRCRNSVYQRCLVDLKPETVAASLQELLGPPVHEVQP